jgi:hypothetical protein
MFASTVTKNISQIISKRKDDSSRFVSIRLDSSESNDDSEGTRFGCDLTLSDISCFQALRRLSIGERWFRRDSDKWDQARMLSQGEIADLLLEHLVTNWSLS